MGLFTKKEKEESRKDSIPSLPELPKLPFFPKMEESKEELPQLPSFPKNAIGEKFSQDTIKKAVNGRKEEAREISEDDFNEEEETIQESPQQKFRYNLPEKWPRKEMPEETMRRMPLYEPPRRITKKDVPEGFEDAERKLMEAEPVFVRIDRFDESKKILEKTKEQISEIERALDKIKLMKQEEGKELDAWEQEILNIKDKISRIERNIFSKV